MVGERLPDASAKVAELPERPRRPAGRADPGVLGAGRVAGRPPRGAPGARRHREPDPQRRGLPGLAAPGAGGAGGAGRRAQAAGRRPGPGYGHRAHRRGERGEQMRSTSVVSVGYGGRPPWAAWASSVRPGWTIRARSPPSGRSRTTWGTSSPAARAGDHRTTTRGVAATRRPRQEELERQWRGTTTARSGSHATRHPRRSSAPTASSPGSCTRTSTRTPRRSTGSRTSRRPTRCCPTRRSGRSSTSAATRSSAGGGGGGAGRRPVLPASASATSWTRSSARPAVPRAVAARAAGCSPVPTR